MSEKPVGIFDSGFGGLTVLKAMADLLPFEDLVYFGDSARYPYGPKSQEDVTRYSIQIADHLIRSFDIKMLVVACNTASAFSVACLSERYSIPVVGMIEPGARALALSSTGKRIGVIATVGTISSGAYQRRISEIAPEKKLVCAATPGFVEFVERGETDSDQLKVLAERLLRPIVDAKVDSLLLGCTHYPFLARSISEVIGARTLLVSSAEETAFQVRRVMMDQALENHSQELATNIFITSGDTGEFRRVGQNLLGMDIPLVEKHTWD